jgi:LmbE family N-acetylglucosaminyl deacetylase
VTRRVAVVVAHPDDDTYGVAGSLALHADEDLRVTVVMTTSGEAGLIADDALADREHLGAVREQEDRAAWAALGIDPEIHFLRYPDGGVADVPREQLVATYLAILQPARPDVVVTFGPEGITGHADHLAVGAAATAAFHAARAAGAEGFQRLLCTSLMRSQLDRFNELLRERGLDPIDETQPFQPRGVPDERIGALVDVTSVYERKLEALRAHRTQAELQDVPFELWPEVLGTEAFVTAYPERDPGGPVLRDVFEGLPPA